MQETIQQNISAHNKIAHSYDKQHTEIYNHIEQNRLKKGLKDIVDIFGIQKPTVLDFGAGTGNLTAHFLDLGCDVTAADVSQKSLSKLQEKLGANIKTQLINGKNLDIFVDSSFDIVAMYSVLHHIPDYLGAVQECVRVLKPGGLLYIDHEVNDNYRNSTSYHDFVKKATIHVPRYKKLLTYMLDPVLLITYVKTRWYRIWDPRYQAEGDIHVYPDDHISRDSIVEVCKKSYMKILQKDDYLLYRGTYDKDIYDTHKDILSDMTVLVARKSGYQK